jgi:hypothetical protein
MGAAVVAFATLLTLSIVHFVASRPVRTSRPAKPADSVVYEEAEPREALVKVKTPCGGPGEECTSSQCCKEGGASGLQCYAKNDGWAQCLESCEKGPHEDETDGHYDASGNFVKDPWSCKELGKRSAKGCDAIDGEKACEKETNRCFWGWKDAKSRTCLTNCSYMSSQQSCGSLANCMWHEDKCKPACATYAEEKKCPVDQCMWKNDACKPACWTMKDSDTCKAAMWEQGCIWQDNQCIVDPCSGGDENCLDTKCCSGTRGGQGKTCFQKDKYYGKCMDTCEEEGWKCKALGNRTRWEAGCAWIGKDCSDTHLCCQEGSSCAVKDDTFTGCVQTKIITTWDARAVPVPEDWEGTVLGGSRAEYEVPPAGEGEEHAGTTLFCFMADLPGSEEVQLMQTAKDHGASIYACDEFAEFESWQSGVQEWDTGAGGASLANTDVFLNVWEQVKNHRGFLKADWTVKVDPDALVVPDRLRAHIAALNPPAYRPIYIKNNGMDPGLGNNGFLGAIEVFSRQAVQIYLDNMDGCKYAFGLATGEDGFLKGCMDALGAGYMTDAGMFKPDFSPGACENAGQAAFHPLKEHSQWLCCYDIVQGKKRHVAYGKCDMGPDGTGPEVEPEW